MSTSDIGSKGCTKRPWRRSGELTLSATRRWCSQNCAGEHAPVRPNGSGQPPFRLPRGAGKRQPRVGGGGGGLAERSGVGGAWAATSGEGFKNKRWFR